MSQFAQVSSWTFLYSIWIRLHIRWWWKPIYDREIIALVWLVIHTAQLWDNHILKTLTLSLWL